MTSRSFSAVIKELEGDLARSVGLGLSFSMDLWMGGTIFSSNVVDGQGSVPFGSSLCA
jgi:hypothetical protein